MKIQRFESPADNREIINLWAEVFGKEEAELEKPQIDGTEIFWNRAKIPTANSISCIIRKNPDAVTVQNALQEV